MKESKQVLHISRSCKILKSSASARRSRRVFRNLTRRCRRKRSKLRYYRYLRELRFKRNTDDLCTAITVFEITDMEWTPSISTPSTEVSEWHKQEQIAYWKSRALSLEYENRMLVQHLRNVYAKQTEDYMNYAKSLENPEQDNNVNLESPVEEKIVRAEQPKQRKEEMEKLYGKMAPRIMGMETAVQLNYELHSEDGVAYWPEIPLVFRFD